MKKFNKVAAITTFVAVGSMALTMVAASTIGAQKAKEVALAHAKLNEKNVTFTKAKMDTDDGVAVYEVEFFHNGVEYDYEINALNGKVREFSKDKEVMAPVVSTKPTTSNTTASKGTIGAQKAKETALSHANLSGQQVTFTKANIDYDDGVAVYEVEFYHNGTEYDYEIDAKTGQVREFSKDQETMIPVVSTKPTVSQGTIGVQKAKEVALSHAKLTGEAVTFTKAGIDHDNGITVYEIEFYHNRVEYNYEINAVSGNIVDFEMDNEFEVDND